MNNSTEFFIKDIDAGIRLDVFLSKKMNKLTRSFIKKIIKEKNVKINNKVIYSPSQKIRVNDKIFVKTITRKIDKLIPAKIDLKIEFEDKDIIIVNKPKGMVVHPGAGNYKNTLANALSYRYKKELSDVNGQLRPGIIHRIDKETSGLLVVAKNNLSHSYLGKQFSDHSIKRKYVCLVWGVIRPLEGTIKTFISRDKKNRQLMTVSDYNGKNAVTNYKTKKVFNFKDIPKISLVECELDTGRTHQIRVHMKYKKTPLVGDMQYGKKNLKFKKINKKFFELQSSLKGQALHAQSLGFIHPTSKKWIHFESKLPNDLKKMLNFLENLSS